jgi:hypothetical protein
VTLPLGRHGWLLAQLLAQFFAFLGRELPLVFTGHRRLLLCLQNIAQFGPTLFALDRLILGRLHLRARLRHSMARAHEEEHQK